eukprot:TRINITY_DN102_c0_g1_i1.p3 TRINITY_DN102_c0_g1~~TRINITY_DN102_c0_g1_i1.p3  ORF type:complete len:129 (-),score=39.85 TRINITY_DN102_c0_g1_i1:55-441(-)
MGWGGNNGKGWGGNNWNPLMAVVQQMMGKGKGKGKGKGNDSPLRGARPERKVYISGIPVEKTGRDLNKELKEHMNLFGGCKFAEVGKNGVGGACFSSEAEAQNAIAKLNGSMFKGSMLQVDAWTKKSA